MPRVQTHTKALSYKTQSTIKIKRLTRQTYYRNARLDVEILSINRIGTNRATVRLRKRLISINGVQTGLFTATLLFEFRPETRRSIDEVWTNPFGFTVLEYSIRSDRLEN